MVFMFTQLFITYYKHMIISCALWLCSCGSWRTPAPVSWYYVHVAAFNLYVVPSPLPACPRAREISQISEGAPSAYRVHLDPRCGPTGSVGARSGGRGGAWEAAARGGEAEPPHEFLHDQREDDDLEGRRRRLLTWGEAPERTP